MSDTTPTTETPASRVPRWAKWTVLGLIAAVVLFFGAILLYTKVINDSPAELGESDLDAALADGASTASTSAAVTTAPVAPVADASAATVAPATEPPGTAAPVTSVAATVAPASSAPATGASNWVATDASLVGYRVQEVLFGIDTTAVGRTNQVTGTMTIDGTQVTATEFVIDVASITSNESRRDDQFRGRIMSADEFPTAGFILTEPIELGLEPADGAEVTTSATGELTLRGVTRPVTFEVIAKQTNGLIGVQGAIPVLFADYQIANPSGGGVSTEDNGLVEFVLVFQPV